MADKDDKKGGKGDSKEPVISLVDFCDAQGVNPVDRNAIYMKYGKGTQKKESEWISTLKGKITLKS